MLWLMKKLLVLHVIKVDQVLIVDCVKRLSINKNYLMELNLDNILWSKVSDLQYEIFYLFEKMQIILLFNVTLLQTQKVFAKMVHIQASSSIILFWGWGFYRVIGGLNIDWIIFNQLLVIRKNYHWRIIQKSSDYSTENTKNLRNKKKYYPKIILDFLVLKLWCWSIWIKLWREYCSCSLYLTI